MVADGIKLHTIDRARVRLVVKQAEERPPRILALVACLRARDCSAYENG